MGLDYFGFGKSGQLGFIGNRRARLHCRGGGIAGFERCHASGDAGQRAAQGVDSPLRASFGFGSFRAQCAEIFPERAAKLHQQIGALTVTERLFAGKTAIAHSVVERRLDRRQGLIDLADCGVLAGRLFNRHEDAAHLVFQIVERRRRLVRKLVDTRCQIPQNRRNFATLASRRYGAQFAPQCSDFRTQI